MVSALMEPMFHTSCDMEIVQPLPVSTCSSLWGGILVLGGVSLGLELPWDSSWSLWWGGGVACARQGSLDTYCLVFLSESVVWTHLGYFLGDDITLHLRVEVRCMHHSEHNWLELCMDDEYSYWFMNVVYIHDICLFFFTNCGYLNLVLVFFIMNSPLQFSIVWLIPVMIANLVCGSRMTAIECKKWDSIVEPPSRRDDVGIILGESCVLLINSSIVSSIILFVDLKM